MNTDKDEIAIGQSKLRKVEAIQSDRKASRSDRKEAANILQKEMG